MAQERTLDVSELIEGRKLGSAQICGCAAALHAHGARRLRHADAVVRSTFDPAGVGRQSRRVWLRAYRASLRLSGRRGVLDLLSATGSDARTSLSPARRSSAFSPSPPAFASSPFELFALRFLAGIGLGGAIPTGIALAAEYMPHKIRATMIGLMFVAYNLGAASGGFHRLPGPSNHLAGTRCSSSAVSPRFR